MIVAESVFIIVAIWYHMDILLSPFVAVERRTAEFFWRFFEPFTLLILLFCLRSISEYWFVVFFEQSIVVIVSVGHLSQRVGSGLHCAIRTEGLLITGKKVRLICVDGFNFGSAMIGSLLCKHPTDYNQSDNPLFYLYWSIIAFLFSKHIGSHLNHISSFVKFIDALYESGNDALIEFLILSGDFCVADVDKFGSVKVDVASLKLFVGVLILYLKLLWRLIHKNNSRII